VVFKIGMRKALGQYVSCQPKACIWWNFQFFDDCLVTFGYLWHVCGCHDVPKWILLSKENIFDTVDVKIGPQEKKIGAFENQFLNQIWLPKAHDHVRWLFIFDDKKKEVDTWVQNFSTVKSDWKIFDNFQQWKVTKNISKFFQQ